MNIKQYQKEPGHYEYGPFTILWGGSRCWQLRDCFDDIVELYPTLRQALAAAMEVCNG